LLIFRYIARDLITTTVAVCSVLLLVIVGGRFVKYLADAATGDLDPGILFAVMGYRLPGFVELILPLAFFLSIFLTYGRMYMENEMTVLFSCGMSQKRLVGYTMIVALGVAVLVAWLSMVVSPAGLQKAEILLDAQKARGELDALLPRQFHSLQRGQGTFYVEAIDENGAMSEVFMAENNPDGEENRRLVVVLADSGYQQKGGLNEDSYLVLNNGYRIQGIPGQADYLITEFAEHGIRLKKRKVRKPAPEADTLSIKELLQSSDVEYRAALHWRLSVPLLVLIVSLMAVPLSKTDPRGGRFSKMFPAMLIYIIYLVMLSAARSALEEGELPIQLGLWPVHTVFLLMAVGLLAWPILQQKRVRQKRAQKKKEMETQQATT